MSATIIDSLVVMLGLDSKDLEKKTPGVKKNLADIEGAGGKAEASVKKTGEGFGGLTRAVGGFLALIGGTVAIKHFVNDFIETNAALERLSVNLGTGVSTISAWGNAAQQVGGSASGLQGTLDMLSRSQTELLLTGQSSLIPYFSSLGISLADMSGKARQGTDVLLDLADAFETRIGSGAMSRPTANNMLRMMGIDQGTANLILQGRKEIELTIAKQKEYGAVTKAQAEEAVKLQRSIVTLKQSFTAFGNSLLMQAAPTLEKLLDYITSFGNWVQTNREFVVDFLKVLAVGLGALALAAIPIDIVVIAIAGLAAGIALLWDDYQTWKRGGDSLIDWGKWKPAIDAAQVAIDLLRKSITGLGEAYDWFIKKTTGVDLENTSWKKILWGGDKGDIGDLGKNGTTNAAEIQKYFTSRGMRADHAAGLAANLMRESGGRIDALGDNGQAYGLGQWHPDRQADFAKFAGHDIRTSTADEQLAFVMQELNGTHARAGKALNDAVGAYASGAAVSRYYEAPRDVAGEAARRGAYAQSLLGIPGAAQVASQAPSATASNSTVSQSVDRSIGEIKIYTQATDAKGISQDIGSAMDYLTYASQANSGVW